MYNATFKDEDIKEPPSATARAAWHQGRICGGILSDDKANAALFFWKRLIRADLPQCPSSVYCLLTVGVSCGRARPDSVRSAKFCAALLCIPSFFAQNTQPSIADLVAKSFNLLPIDVAARAPVLRVLTRKWLDDGRTIAQRLNGWQSRNGGSVDSRLAGCWPGLGRHIRWNCTR